MYLSWGIAGGRLEDRRMLFLNSFGVMSANWFRLKVTLLYVCTRERQRVVPLKQELQLS